MEYRVPQYLHRPTQLAWFEQDEILAILGGYLTGFFLGGWWYLAIFVVPWVYIRARRRLPRGFLLHLQYMAGLMTFRGYPHHFMRRFEE